MTFKKNERITSKLLMDYLFNNSQSKSLTTYPLKAIYAVTDHHADDAQVQVLVSVSKRHFKRAVKRNRCKRQVREQYRLHKDILPQIPEGKQLLIAFLWMSDELMPSSRVEYSMRKLLKSLAKSLQEEGCLCAL